MVACGDGLKIEISKAPKMTKPEDRYGVRIFCPKCGRIGAIHGRSDGLNDNESLRDFEAPEGFRQVSIGWRSADVYLFCVTCGVAACMKLPGGASS